MKRSLDLDRSTHADAFLFVVLVQGVVAELRARLEPVCRFAWKVYFPRSVFQELDSLLDLSPPRRTLTQGRR